MKIYDLVKQLLTDFPELRNSDKKLIWAVCWKKQLVQVNRNKMLSQMLYMNFLQSPPFSSIDRAARKVRELHPELRPSKKVQQKKDAKELTKGTFIYREEV